MDFEKMREAAIAELEGFRVLEESTDAAERQRAAFIAAALNTLPQQEQEILRQFFIDRRCRYAGHRAKLQAMYGLSLSELYRQKNEAIPLHRGIYHLPLSSLQVFSIFRLNSEHKAYRRKAMYIGTL